MALRSPGGSGGGLGRPAAAARSCFRDGAVAWGARRRQQVHVLAQPVAGPFDLYDNGMMQQSVEQGGGDDGIAKNLTPFGKSAVGGEDHGALLVAGVDQLEEQITGGRADREVSDFIDDQELRAAEIANALAQPTLAIGAGEAVDDVGERGESKHCGRHGRPRRPGRRQGDFCRCRIGR